MAANGAIVLNQDDKDLVYGWGDMLSLTSLVASMVVNALVTGLIAFKILKVFWEVKPTSVEETLGSLNSTGGPKLRRIIFIIIESGMALFAIQLVHVVIGILLLLEILTPSSLTIALNRVASTHEILNVIIRPVHSTSFVLLIIFTSLGHRTDNNFSAGLNEGLNEIVLR